MGRLEVINESLLMVANYHMLCFSKFNLDKMQRFNMGWSFLMLLSLIVFLNIIYVIIGQIEKVKRSRSLKKKRNAIKNNKIKFEEFMKNKVYIKKHNVFKL